MRHYIAPNLIDRRHRINVALVGAGGTGSHVLTGLAKIHHSLAAFDHPGLYVRVFDDDVVSDANVGRQMFARGDVGQHKGVILVSRVNGYFGLDWDAVPARFPLENAGRGYEEDRANLLVTCVDTGRDRMRIAKHLDCLPEASSPQYWLDMGNSATTGQVVLGTGRAVPQPESAFDTVDTLPTIVDLFPDLEAVDEEDQTPSCSLRESLFKQDLFVNAVMADLGCSLVWRFIKESFTEECGFFCDMGRFRTSPLLVDPASWERFGFKGAKGTMKAA